MSRPRWEYATVGLSAIAASNDAECEKFDAELQRLGGEGWELVAVTQAFARIVRGPQPSQLVYTFKRQLADELVDAAGIERGDS